MAVHLPNCKLSATQVCFPAAWLPNQWLGMAELRFNPPLRTLKIRMSALDRNSIGGSDNSSKKAATPNLNYVVPLDKSSCITRPLAEILRDLNKKIPDNIVKTQDDHSTFIPWYQANRMLSFYAPGWCGEIRDVIFADNGSVTVVYRVTVRGLDGEPKQNRTKQRKLLTMHGQRYSEVNNQAHRESTGTVSPGDGDITDPVAAAEELAFCRACARFGLGLYLYHED